MIGATACSDLEGEASPPRTTAPAAADPRQRTRVAVTDLGPFYVDRKGMAGPGTPLGAGLEVPEGALLLGVAFPDLEDGGYRALLLVTGDPVDVFNAVSDQAGGRGMEGGGDCVGAADQVACSGDFVDGADGESLRVDLSRQVGTSGVVSGLGLRYRPPGSTDADDAAPTSSAVPPAPSSAVTLPPPPVVAPDDADVVRALQGSGSPPRLVERGSALVGLPGPCGCGPEGWSFVVRLTGVQRDVVAAYARQLSDLGDPPDIDDRQRDGLTVLSLGLGSGATVGEVRAVLTDDGSDYAMVTVTGPEEPASS